MSLFPVIRTEFGGGEENLQLVRSLDKTSRKIARYRNHVRFNLTCFNSRVTPRDLRLKTDIKGHKASNIIQRAERALLNERIRQHNFTLGILKSKQQNLKDRIRGVLPEGTYNRVIDYTEHSQLREHHIVKNRQVAKFNRLRSEQKRSEEISRDNQGKNNQDKW